MNEEQLRAELDAVYQSISWKLTAPLRKTFFYIKKIFTHCKRILIRSILWFLRKPFILTLGKRLLNYFPNLNIKLRNKYYHLKNSANRKIEIEQIIFNENDSRISSISISASDILNQLQNAVADNHSKRSQKPQKRNN